MYRGRHRKRSRRRGRNPFRPALATQRDKLDEALEVVKIISDNVEAHKARSTGSSRHNPYVPAWDETALDDHEDPENIYTPLNLIAQSTDPKTSHQLLKLLLSDGGDERVQFYGDVVDQLERGSKVTWNMGDDLPDHWFAEYDDPYQGPITPIDMTLEGRKFRDRAHTFGVTANKFRDELSSLPKPRRRLRRRR
jgi:hypothetical protein